MDTNMNKSFSTERGFFREADTGAGGGGGGGIGGSAKDDENINDENKNDEKKDEQTSDKESNADIFTQLQKNLQKIGKLIRQGNSRDARKVLLSSRELINNYEPQSDEERWDLLFHLDRLKLKAKTLYKGVEGEPVSFQFPENSKMDSSQNAKADQGSKDDINSNFQAQKTEKTDNNQSIDQDSQEKDDNNNQKKDDEYNQGEELNRLLLNIDKELNRLEIEHFVFADDKDWVGELFVKVQEYFAKLEELQGVSKEILIGTEIKILQLEYKSRRQAMFNTLEQMEKTEYLTEGFFARAIEGPGLNRMRNIAARLKQQNAENAGSFLTDYEKINKYYLARKWLLISWLYVRPKIFDGSGEKGERSSFGQVGDNQFPIKGEHFQELIKGGLEFDSEFGSMLNQKMGVESVLAEKFGEQLNEGESPRKERKEIDVTLFSFCMKEFDRVYKNGQEGTGNVDPNGKPIERVNTQNLREKKNILIDYVWKKAQKYVEEHSSQTNVSSGVQIDRHAIELAFRTHLLLTMHHCRYADGSPSLKDDWYYVFNWPSYVLGYREKGVDKFDWRATILQFGLRPGYKRDGQVAEENVLAKMFDASKVRAVERKLNKRGLLDESVRGLRSLRGLINGYSILLEEVSSKGTDGQNDVPGRLDYAFLAPPLRYLRQKDKDGRFIRGSAPAGSEGLHVFLDEITDEKGNILYEELNYKDLGSDLMEYYNNMNQHGINSFLNQFIKADRFEFLDNATNPKILKNWKNEARYCAPLLPRVGKFALMGMKDFGDPVKINPDRYPTEEAKKEAKPSNIADAVMDRILYQIIFINCILRTSYTIEKKYFWSDLELKSYLQNLNSERILSTEESKGIYEAVMAYRGEIKMFTKSLVDETMDQVVKRNIFK